MNRSGRPLTSNTDKIQQNQGAGTFQSSIDSKRTCRYCWYIKKIDTNIFNGKFGLVLCVFSLCFKKFDLFEKQDRAEVSEELLSMTDDDLKCMTTGDEIWIFCF